MSRLHLPVLALVVTASAACQDESTFSLALPAKLRIAEMQPAQQSQLRAEIEAPGLVGVTALELTDETRSRVSGAFVVVVQEARTVPVSVRVFGRLTPTSDEVLLGVARQDVAFAPRETSRLEYGDDDWRVDGAAVFDPNGNGRSSVDDLVNGHDPAAPRAVIEVAPADLQFAAGVRPGEFTRQVIVVENVTPLPQEISGQIVGGQGMSVVRVDATGAPEQGAPRALSFALQPFQQQLLAVTFAPSNEFLVRGSLALQAFHVDSNVTSSTSVSLFANPDGEPQPVLAGYAPAPLDGAVLGLPGVDVAVYPPALLFGGQPLSPGTVQLSANPEDKLDVAALSHAANVLDTAAGSVPVSALFLVELPPRHRISVELDGLVDNADLALVLLDPATDAPSTADGEVLISRNPGTNVDVAQFRNTSSTLTRRAVVVVGRVDEREVVGADDGRTPLTVPFQLLAQLNAGPELADVQPVSPTTASFGGGETVTIRGVAFETGATVRFGVHDADRTRTVVNDDGTEITTEAPGADAGDVGVPLVVVVTNLDGQAATHPPVFVYAPPAPEVAGVDPPSASTLGGTPLTITGAFFADDAAVLIGGAPATDVDVVSSTRIQCNAPTGSDGFTTLVVTNPNGGGPGVPLSSAPFTFVYVAPAGDAPVVDAVDPDTGAVAGGTPLVITGSGFGDDAVVRIGGTVASGVVVGDGGDIISCFSPPSFVAGPVELRVSNADGQTSAPVTFTYFTPPPVLVDAVPDFASTFGGTRIFIDGQNLVDGAAAFFRQNALTVPATESDFVSSTRIIVTSPSGLGAGDAELFVVNPDGQPSASLSLTIFPVLAPAPRILALNPASVRVDAVGTPAGNVVVTGQNFDPASLLLFIDDSIVPITPGTATTTSFAFAAPPHGVGVAIVRVVNGDGQDDADALVYAAPLDPNLATVTPDVVGALVPGDVVSVGGANLSPLADLPAGEIDERFYVENPAAPGVRYRVSVLDLTSTLLRVRLEDALPDGVGYRVFADFASPAGSPGALPPSSSPPFAALQPVLLTQQVVAGSPAEGNDISVLLQGVSLNPARISRVRFTLPLDPPAADLVVEEEPSVVTASLVRVDLVGGLPQQGAWTSELVYDFVDGDGAAQSLAVAAPGTIAISGECGNGVIDAGEDCDSVELGGLACSDVGFFGGTLRCSPSCVLDTRQCDQCGDGIIDAADGEECDGANIGGTTCAALVPGSTSGTPTCTPQCTLSASECGICGNGVIEGAEQCDLSNFGGATCATLGFNAGQIGCDDELCILDGALCSTCGNNRCDTLETNANCAVDCAVTCGNGVCDAAEACTTCPRDCGGQCTAPFTLALASGGGQNGAFARDLAQPFVVRASDAGGAPLVGLQVTFTAPAGAVAAPAVTLTDANGNASALPTLPRTLGAASFSVTGTGPDGALLAGAPLSIGATATDIAAGIAMTLANQPAAAARATLPAAASKAALNLDAQGASGVAFRPSDGSVFVADTVNNRVVRIDADGTAHHFAGSAAGTAGFIDNVAATAGQLNQPKGVAVDAAGHVYIADATNNRVRRVDAGTGIITTFAGGGASTTDGVLATTAQLSQPASVIVSPSTGELFLLNAGFDNVRKVQTNGQITTVVPSGQTCSTGNLRPGPLNDTQLALDPTGRLLLISQPSNIGGCPVSGEAVLRLENDGTYALVAGGPPGAVDVDVGNARNTATFGPTGLASDAAGNVYFSERLSTGQRVRKVSALGVISTFMGTKGVAANAVTRGDGNAAASALLSTPGFLALATGAGGVGGPGDLLVSEAGLDDVRLVRDVAEDVPPVVVAQAFGGNQSATIDGALAQPIGLAVEDGNGEALAGIAVTVTPSSGAAAEPSSGVTDVNGVFTFVGFVGRAPGPYSFSIAAVGVDGFPLQGSPFVVNGINAVDVGAGVMHTVVNQLGTVGTTLSANASRSRTNFSTTFGGVAVDDADGSLYVSDTDNHRVLRVSATGAVSVVAGTGTAGRGANGPALTIQLQRPRGLAVDVDGNVFIADTENDYVRLLNTSSGQLTIFAGNNLNDPNAGDGVVATGANLDNPEALALAPDGDLVIVDVNHQRIRRVEIDAAAPTTPGVISTVMLGGLCVPGNVRPNNLFGNALAFDRSGRLYFGGDVVNGGSCPLPDLNEDYVFRRENDGTLTALAGGPTVAGSGPAFGTQVRRPAGLAVDEAGNLFVVETTGHRVRRIDVMGAMTTIAGDGVAGFVNDNVPASTVRVSSASGAAMDSAGNLYLYDGGNNRVRMIRDVGEAQPRTATLGIVDGDGQTGTIGQLPNLPLRVDVRDGAVPIAGLPVAFTPLDLGDVVTVGTVSTGLAGDASTTVRLGRSDATPHRFQARAQTWLDPADITGSPVTFTLSAARPAAGSTVAIVNSVGLVGNVPAGANGEIAATAARLNFNEAGVAIASDGTLFVADPNNSRVVSVSPEGHLAVFAGTGVRGFLDNVDATAALLDTPQGVAVDAAGNVYIADASSTTAADRLRRVGLDGIITTIAGGAADVPGHGDGGSGSGVFFSDPGAVAVGPDGAVYVVDNGLNNVRRVNPASPFFTTSFVADGGSCTSTTGTRQNDIVQSGVSFDGAGRMYFVASNANGGGCPIPGGMLNSVNLFRRETSGALTVIAGNGGGSTADGVAGVNTRIQTVGGLHADAAGDVVYVEQNTHRIRKIVGAGAVPAGTFGGALGNTVTIVGQNGLTGFGSLTSPPGTSALLSSPSGMIVDPVSGDLYWTEDTTSAVRMFIP